MRLVVLIGLVLAGGPVFAKPAARLQADRKKVCDACDGWNKPLPPIKVFANTFYVGTTGLSAMLVTSAAGHVLLDGALPQSAALIDAGIRALGFDPRDVKVILSSHAHYDHAGGIAALQRATGATVMASAWGAKALARGGPLDDDPQSGAGKEANAFPPVENVKVVQDGEVVRVGALAITAHLLPGHTPGSTSWTWEACEPAGGGPPRCLHIVYADSLTPVSAAGYRFTDHPALIDTFRASISKLAALPCDIVVSTHPDFTATLAKLRARGAAAAGEPVVDPQGCRSLASAVTKLLDDRIAAEQRR